MRRWRVAGGFAGPGTLTLSGANNFTGGLNVTSGTLVAGSDAALGAVGNITYVASGATLDFNARTLQGYTNNIQIAGTGVTASIGALGTDTTFSGNIVDSVGGGGTTALTKVGGGTLTLAGTSTTGAKLSPGASPGNLPINTGTGSRDISAAVAGSATGALVWEIDSTPAVSDLVTLTGPLNIGSGLLEWGDFAFTPGSLTPYTTITLIDSNNTIAGTLGSTLSGSLGGGSEGYLSFADSDTNLVLNIVPEPGTAAPGLLALASLSTRRRRSQQA